MREILFRGKSNYGNVGEWEYGLVAQPHVTEDGIVTSYYFTKLDENGWSSQRTVSANTIGQYTGLTDKNGKRIFEGDIVSHFVNGKEFKGVVQYADGAFGISCESGAGQFLCFCNNGEVIGNIHDNPELLGGEE